MKKVTELTYELAKPFVEEQGCELWDVEYVREGGVWILRVLLDKPGGVDILDCEAISRKLSDALDEVDPIEGSYTLEVGSAGAERALRRQSDFDRYAGAKILLKTYQPKGGAKEFPGELIGRDAQSGEVRIKMGEQELTFSPKEIALVRLRVDFD